MNKIKAVFLAANPEDTSRLKLDEEIRAITEKLRASEHRDFLELVSLWAVRADDLLQALNVHKPHIVHFSGHGSRLGEILLVDSSGQPRSVSTKAIKALFTTLQDNIRVVILNACYSRSQAEAITGVIDCTIGMNAAIGDRAAIIFAASFYRAIGFGRSVQEAFDQGKTALLLEGIPEDDTPELLCRTGIDPSQVVLLESTSSETQFLPARGIQDSVTGRPPHLTTLQNQEGDSSPKARYERLISDMLNTVFYIRDESGRIVIDSTPGKIHHRRKYLGKRSGHEYEIDLSFEIDLFGASMLVLIECKLYNDRVVSINDLLEFSAKLDDIGANKGIVITTMGFDSDAIQVAQARGIALIVADYGRWAVVHRFQEPPRERSDKLLYGGIALVSVENDCLKLGYCPADLVDFVGTESDRDSTKFGLEDKPVHKRLLFHIVTSGGPAINILPDEGSAERVTLLSAERIREILEKHLDND